LFMGLISMIVVPLVVSSVTLAVVSGHDLEHLRKTGLGVGLYFVATTVNAVIIGIMVATIIQPGRYVPQELLLGATEQAAELDELPVVKDRPPLPEMLMAVFPVNPIKALVEKAMLQIVIGSILLGVALLSIGQAKSAPLVSLTESVQAVSMKFVDWAMAVAPYAVFFFLCVLTAQLGLETLKAMSVYMGSVLLGLVLLLC